MKVKWIIRKFCLRKKGIRKIYQAGSWIKGWLYYASNLLVPILKHKKKFRNPVFLVFTPQHANLGDHAIAYAEKIILDRLQIPFFEITGEQLRILDYYKMLSSLDKSLILINGGGNIGTLWPTIEQLNRRVVIANPHATIMVLPNTMYYGKSREEQKELEISKSIYNSHSQLFFYAREKLSLEAMKRVFKNVKIAPDVVLSLDFTNIKLPRKGVLICLRSDTEAILSKDELEKIDIIGKKIFGNNITKIDTVLEYNVSVANREKELLCKIKEFCAAELVITDRLHGMIFCAITGTNCIVLDSKSPKIRGCYEWIKKLDYIRFIENVADIELVYRQIKNGEKRYNNSDITISLRELEQDIMEKYTCV